ncbi:MAG: cell wall hydrolase, partial [Sphingosinicella sp.]
GGGCQFTFTCDGSLRRRPEARRWAIARLIAAEALAGQTFRPVADSTHYHASYVSPRWAPRLVRTAAIGLHRFYRSPGIGEAPTARYAEFGGGSTTSSGAYVAAAGRPVRFAATTVPGVTVHRGGAGAGPVRGPAPAQAGVRVHRGALPTIPGPQPLPQPAPGFDLAAVSR